MTATAAGTWSRTHLVGIDGLTAGEITYLLDAAERFRPVATREAPPQTTLAGRIVANLFFEDSTRTRCSFSIAAGRLGAVSLDFVGGGSSISKGETLLDTVNNIAAMGVDAMVVRASAAGTADLVAGEMPCPVINAGDGRHEHPTQGLLDALTLRQRLGSLEGRLIAIVGDIANSRVARSNLHCLTTLGANVLLIGPPTLVSPSFERIVAGPGRVHVSYDLDSALPEVDAIMMLRIQLERDAGGAIGDDYRRSYGLTADRAACLRPGAIVMHPGPMNRRVEIDSEVADDPERSVILDQVTNGVAVRMAVLETLVKRAGA